MRAEVKVIVLRNKEILLVKENSQWNLPGGKPDPQQSDEQYIKKLLSELGLVVEALNPFTMRSSRFEPALYLAEEVAKAEPTQPSTNLTYRWFKKPRGDNISEIVKLVLKKLERENYL